MAMIPLVFHHIRKCRQYQRREDNMRTLHLISHTHWDREWYLTFQQFRLKLVRLVDHLLDILERDSQYKHFMLDGQTIVLEDYLQIRPEREGDLRKYIQEGRILIGPWYILPDEFLVSPESTIRNLLEGERTSKAFGPKMMVGYIPDPFGHIGQMPQILRGFGIETASVMRGLSDEPCELWWQSPDGSRVLMAYMRDSYGNAAGILNGGVDHFAVEAQRLSDALAPYSAAPHTLLMHGVDHMEPHPDTSAAVACAEGRLNSDVLIHSTLPDYFAALAPFVSDNQLPVVTGELRSPKRSPLLPAVLSARMWIKQRNHACETLLEKWAEPFTAWADLVPQYLLPEDNLTKPWPVLRQAWRLLMQNHPHDSICGCSIDAVHDEMRTRFDQVEQMAEGVISHSLEALAAGVTTISADPGSAVSALVVFNPASGPRTDMVSALIETQPDADGFEIVDEAGSSLPFYQVGLGSRDLITMTMKRAEFRSAFLSTSGGEVMGMKLMELSARSQDNQVFVELSLSEKGEPNLPLLLTARKEIEAFLEDPALTTYNIHARSVSAAQVYFSATGIPAYGYSTFYVRPKAGVKKEPVRLNPVMRGLMPIAAKLAANPAAQRVLARVVQDPAKKPPFKIENEYFRVEVQSDGALSVFDKRSGAIYAGLNCFIDGGDRGDEYNYSPPAPDLLTAGRLKSARVERNEAWQRLDLTLEMRIPSELQPGRKERSREMVKLTIRSQVTLTSGVGRIDIHTEIDNNARDHRLRVHFPVPFAVTDANYDGHFEVVRRPVGVPQFDSSWVEQPRPEVPMRAFTAVESGSSGFLIAARGLPEVEVLRQPNGNAEIALSLLRSVGWLSRDDFPERAGHAGPFLATPGAQMIGTWSFDYAVVPYQGPHVVSAYHQAYAFQVPLRVVSARLHDGFLPPSGSFIQVDPPEFVLSAVKTSEDGRGWLVRGYNLSAESKMVTLRTLNAFQTAERVDLAEQAQETLEKTGDEQVTFNARPHEVVTVLFSG
jgi:mannosylglycerate hydrolase